MFFVLSAQSGAVQKPPALKRTNPYVRPPEADGFLFKFVMVEGERLQKGHEVGVIVKAFLLKALLRMEGRHLFALGYPHGKFLLLQIFSHPFPPE